MNRAQERFGEPVALVKKKVLPVMSGMIQDFIREAPFAVLATANEHGDCDASPKGGRAGFVKVLDEKRLVLPDIAGNNLFQSYENVESNRKAGLLFLLPGCDWTVRVNGQASVVDTEAQGLAGIAPEVFADDDNTRILQGLMIEVEEAYAHCPRAFFFSKLWNTEEIEKRVAEDPNSYWFGRFRRELGNDYST